MTNYKDEDKDNRTYPEVILGSILDSYTEGFNKMNDKYDTKFHVTLTNQKQAFPDGNKDLAYLRIERGIRPKATEEEWSMSLVIGDFYIFRDMQERTNPKAPWKEQLFVNVVGKLMALGIEYAEFLRRTKAKRDADEKEASKGKLDLVITDKMPSALNKDEEEYKKWLTAERAKEGL